MTNSRILHAAARGARIQVEADNNWYGTARHLLHQERRSLRIHPKDAHLAYGPISTALRDRVFYGPFEQRYAGALHFCREYFEFNYLLQDHDEFNTTLLFLAEALADEGM